MAANRLCEILQTTFNESDEQNVPIDECPFIAAVSVFRL